jgi:ubiquinone/menaquinone biosynthesis C-methylase UbiE
MAFLTSIRKHLKRLMIAGPGRDARQNPDEVISALALEPGDKVADIGAGSGYFTFRIARAVAPGGRVFAVDTDQGMLELIAEHPEAVASQITTVQARAGDPELPEPVDLVFLSHSFHHLPSQRSWFAAVRSLLRDGGRVAILEPRPGGFFSRLFGHATAPEEISAVMQDAGYRLLASHEVVATDSLLEFEPTITETPQRG